ncbi:MAG: glycerol-3-phosphate acyltransferase, partial [Dehalococcoidales bacterium]|nr:glycerol-3-phosphate acyltransferase [Dehalococcoidales bacterium]
MLNFAPTLELPEYLWQVQTILLSLACYIYGSIPFPYLFTYIFKREKLTDKGTGNIGIANTFGTAGLKIGFLAVTGEATKAILPIILSRYYYDGTLLISLIFISFSILGTSYSIFLKGKGSQGTTILLWALLILSPYAFLLFITVFAVTFIVFRKRYLTTYISYALLPVELFAVGGNIYFVVFGIITAIFYCLRYKPQKSDYSFYIKNMRLLRFVEQKLKKHPPLIINITEAKNISKVGEKAKNLWYLKKIGAQIPKTYVCTFHAYDEYKNDNLDIINTLKENLNKVIGAGKSYSIRSSANIEDNKIHSFAGQFDSYLNVSSIDEIIKTIFMIWESVNGDRVKAYLKHINIISHELKMAVIIQEMIKPNYSGVIFTKNPITGLSEIIVELVTGSGESLLQDGNTPQRWIYKWGTLIEKPKDSTLDSIFIKQLILQARKIEKKYGAPVDLEWVSNGNNVYWMQLRKITTLRGVDIYSNRISKGFMPGIIKPLIWSVNIPVVNTSWKRLFIELIGNKAQQIDINELAKSFYYRAYFNMGIIGDIFELIGMPRELIELLLGYEVSGDEKPKFRPGFKTIRYIPRMLLFALQKSMFSKKIESLLTKRDLEYNYYKYAALDKMNDIETIKAIEHLFKLNTDTSYYVIVSQLLMGFYNTVLTRFLARKGISLNFENLPSIHNIQHDINPGYLIEKLHNLYMTFPEEIKKQIANTGNNSLLIAPNLLDFKKQVEDLLNKFGYLSDSGNDFSKPQWKENPGIIIDTIINYKNIQNNNNRHKSAEFPDIHQDLLISYFYNKAARYRAYREKVNSLYEYGYSLFRPYFLHLADIFYKKSYISNTDDIFYLTFSEITDIVNLKTMPKSYKANIGQKKMQILKWQNVKLPEIIIGDDIPFPLQTKQISKTLKGVAASKGYCKGRIRLVSGLNDFPKVQDKDILVIPHSDISWTPIYSKAKAVISESGGMLSHCAIIAREYNIPAVVSLPNAMQLIDGTL